MAPIDSTAIQAGPSAREELANTVSHGIGALLAVGALVTIVAMARGTGSAWAIAAASVYGATLFAVFATSTLYHGTREPAAKSFFLLLDHIAIFLLIAGTYTPITLLAFPMPLGGILCSFLWALAALGIGLRIWHGELHWMMIPLFLAMGWTGFAWLDIVFASMTPTGAWLVITGGLAYSGGVGFYLWDRLPYNHALWHLFVLAGSALHFAAIALYVIPAAV